VSAFDPTALPPDLPVPEDDGGAAHLPGLRIPAIALRAGDGREVRLDRAGAQPRTVVYAFPRMGRPGVDPPAGWDEIPGARGCTPESCGFRDHHAELASAGADVFGLSTQSTAEQQEAVQRLALPFALLSDPDLELTGALALPTMEVEGERLLKRLTLVIRDGSVEHVFYPVFPPDAHAGEVLRWLEQHPVGGRPGVPYASGDGDGA
jgi:peroxiredoxin